MIKLEPTDIEWYCFQCLKWSGNRCSLHIGGSQNVQSDRLREVLQDLLDSNFTAWGDGTYKPSTITTYNDIKERFAVLFKETATCTSLKRKEVQP